MQRTTVLSGRRKPLMIVVGLMLLTGIVFCLFVARRRSNQQFRLREERRIAQWVLDEKTALLSW